MEEGSIEGLSTLSDELDEEETRLRRLYEQARGEEQRRLIKGIIRQVAANFGSVEASDANATCRRVGMSKTSARV